MTNDVQTVVRLPSSLVSEVDALAKKLSEPGLRITRASVLRMLITQGVVEAKKRDGGEEASPRKRDGGKEASPRKRDGGEEVSPRKREKVK